MKLLGILGWIMCFIHDMLVYLFGERFIGEG